MLQYVVTIRYFISIGRHQATKIQFDYFENADIERIRKQVEIFNHELCLDAPL
jgi:hypothetical protein